VPVFHDLTVARLDRLTEDAISITLAVPDQLREAYRFRPGQHLTFRHPTPDGEIRRTFSIWTTPESGVLAVAVKLLPTGVFSTHVRDGLTVGDRVSVMTPAGRFGPRPVDDDAPRTYAAVVAGSGITPILSIFGAVLGEQPGATCVLLYGNRTSASVMFAEEIADLKDRYLARLQVLHVLSQENQGSELLSGRIDATKLGALLHLHPPATVHEWFLCGPGGLVDLAHSTLTAAGMDRRQIHRELFWTGSSAAVPTAPAPMPGPHLVRARLDGRTTSFAMPSNGSLLDALLAHRPEAPYACRGGVCGTCRMRVIEGEVAMTQNYSLDPADLEAGFRLACQAVPSSGALTVDFDA